MVMLKSLSFFGITSVNTNIERLTMPNAAAKMVNEKLMTGSKLKCSTGYPRDFSITYVPNVIKPTAVPMFDTAKSDCGNEKRKRNGFIASILKLLHFFEDHYFAAASINDQCCSDRTE